MALVTLKPGIFNKGKKVGDVVFESEKKVPKRTGRARAPKPKQKAVTQTSAANPPATATGGGGKGGLPTNPRFNTPAAGSDNLPVPRSASGVAKMRAGRAGRAEKFMGNAERAPNEALPGLGGKTKSRMSAGKAAVAGGAVAAAAALYGSRDNKTTQTVTPPSVSSGSSSSTTPTGPSVNLKKPPTGGKPDSMGGATPPTTGSKTKTPSSSSGSSRRGAGKNESMADYLGLSKDSAVRTYMETGKHKYEPKYPTPTGQKAGTVTKAAKRTQKTR